MERTLTSLASKVATAGRSARCCLQFRIASITGGNDVLLVRQTLWRSMLAAMPDAADVLVASDSYAPSRRPDIFRQPIRMCSWQPCPRCSRRVAQPDGLRCFPSSGFFCGLRRSLRIAVSYINELYLYTYFAIVLAPKADRFLPQTQPRIQLIFHSPPVN